MKHLPRPLLALALAALWPAAALAEGPVWKIIDGERELYLGGTIHVLGKSDYPLPPTFERAYQAASTVVFETDIQKLQDPAFQRDMLVHLMYPDGQTVDQYLSEATYRLLEQHLAKYNVSLDQLKRFRPGLLATNITLLELARLGLAGTGVDQFYSARALEDDKTLGQLETALSQIQVIGTMGEGQEDAFIRHTLQEVDSLPRMFQDIKRAWREGDTGGLEAAVVDPIDEAFPAIYQSLLVQRNLDWMPRLVELLETPEVELVLVGAAHLVGDDGLLHKLRALGYTVEQL